MSVDSERHAAWVGMFGLRYPYGECQCGCGQDAPIATRNDPSFGVEAGKPQRFIRGHCRTGPHPTLEAAFFASIDRRGPDECWPAHSLTGKDGYGQVCYRGKVYRAHRLAYTLFVGPIPDGLWVLHRCDCPPCANAAHLFLGTRQDNISDMIRKGRGHWQRAARRRRSQSNQLTLWGDGRWRD